MFGSDDKKMSFQKSKCSTFVTAVLKTLKVSDVNKALKYFFSKL
jgi:hypothetical protein